MVELDDDAIPESHRDHSRPNRTAHTSAPNRAGWRGFLLTMASPSDGPRPHHRRERRRWYAAGPERSDAELVQRRIDLHRPAPRGDLTVGGFLSTTWLATKQTVTAPTRNR